jgi:hypothetical protein
MIREYIRLLSIALLLILGSSCYTVHKNGSYSSGTLSSNILYDSISSRLSHHKWNNKGKTEIKYFYCSKLVHFEKSTYRKSAARMDIVRSKELYYYPNGKIMRAIIEKRNGDYVEKLFNEKGKLSEKNIKKAARTGETM